MQTEMDPEEVLDFAAGLIQRMNDLRDVNSRAKASALFIEDTWRDAKSEEFLQLLETATLEIAEFCDHAQHYADRLQQKAQITLDGYSNRHYR